MGIFSLPPGYGTAQYQSPMGPWAHWIEGNEAADTLAGEGALRGSAIGMEAEPTISGSDPSSGNFGTRLACAGGTRSLKNSPSGTDAGQTPTRLIHCRNSNSDDQRSTAGLPSARRMATSTGTTASSTTKTPNSTAHAAAESHQSTSLSATKPRGLSDTGQNAPRHLQPTGQRQSPTFAAWTPSSLLNYWSSQASTRGSARGNSFICFLNKVFWHPPITTHLDPPGPPGPSPP
ncbi:hypothetical protein PDIDSM_160 [Penicillium digitatum]|nr:hypothetical protein PDIDSM_160 [Penicillium digitatum]